MSKDNKKKTPKKPAAKKAAKNPFTAKGKRIQTSRGRTRKP